MALKVAKEVDAAGRAIVLQLPANTLNSSRSRFIRSAATLSFRDAGKHVRRNRTRSGE